MILQYLQVDQHPSLFAQHEVHVEGYAVGQSCLSLSFPICRMGASGA